MNLDTLVLVTITFWIILVGIFITIITNIVSTNRKEVEKHKADKSEMTDRYRIDKIQEADLKRAGGTKD